MSSPAYGYKGAHATKYGGAKKARSNKCGGMDCRVFVNKDDPDYKHSYGNKYTERQLKVLSGEIPLAKVRSTDLYALMKKAEQMEDWENAETAEHLYNKKMHPNEEEYQPTMSYEEALDFLNTNNTI